MSPSSRPEFPTHFQKKICWTGLTSLAALTTILITVFTGWVIITGLGFLQPVLIPLAIAAILAYLLNPVVAWLCRRHLPRTWSVITVFALFLLLVTILIFWIGPLLHRQGNSFAKNLPSYTERAQSLYEITTSEINHLIEATHLHANNGQQNLPDKIQTYGIGLLNDGMIWLQQKLPTIAVASGNFLKRSIGGVFGIFGFLLSLILVPLFLFFFLLETPSISSNWSRYLPLRASPLKDEIVSLLLEINDYLIHFFRGQLLVSLVDGALIAFSLFLIIGLDFSFLIGLFVGILGLVPYAGIILCWLPAVLIAAAQFGDWWHPLIVTIIFLAANNLDGILITPKIVGKSVGLHPLTIILSVLSWSILLGGLMGALLAVPLTATLKVLLRRYVWDRPPNPVPLHRGDGDKEAENSPPHSTITIELPL